MREQKEFKERNAEESNEKKRKYMGWKRVISIALFIIAGYYLLISAGIIPGGVTFGNYRPDEKALALIAITLIIIGLLLDDIWRRKIKNALS